MRGTVKIAIQYEVEAGTELSIETTSQVPLFMYSGPLRALIDL